MRFLVDESTGQAVTAYLRRAGHDVMAVAESLPQADDITVLQLAARESRILITNDKDFGDLVYRSGLSHHGIILLRLNDESPSHRVAMLQTVIEHHAAQLPDTFVIVTERHIRFRSALPHP